MRKVTRETCNAFMVRTRKAMGNTSTDGQRLSLHGNVIAEWRDDGLWVTNAGWPSNTTRERLNGLRGVSVTQRNSYQYLNGHKWHGSWVRVEGFTGNVSDSDSEKIAKLKKTIAAYSKLYVKPYPMPSGGDCWHCAMVTNTKQSLGDATKNYEHLLEHLGIAYDDSEVYVHGSMIVNAMREAGYHDESIAIHLQGMGADDTIPRTIRKYLTKRLIPSIGPR